MRHILVLIFSLFANGLLSQVVYSDPPEFTQFDDVTIFFDATKGNGALANFSGSVYAHTGVITSQSTSGSDWKHVIGNWGTADSHTLMKKKATNLYSLSYNVNDFYGITPGEDVLKLAFVFRNVDGSVVGRDADGSDIFIDVDQGGQGLLASISSPPSNGITLLKDDSLKVQLEINQTAQIQITDNQVEIYNSSADAVEFYIRNLVPGDHSLIFNISQENNTLELQRSYSVLDLNQRNANAPPGIINGVNYTDSSYIFQLEAPGKRNCFFLTSENDFVSNENYLMNKSEDGTRFWIELDKSLFNQGRNTYQYLVDGNIIIADPFSTVVLDPWHDWEVDSRVKAQLPPYPTQTSGVVTAFEPSPTDYPWQISSFEKPAKSDLVIYEILLRDFLEEHSFNALSDTLDYLARLGVNAIELIPINEFEGNNSWGYNPSYHMAVDKYYGTRNDLRRLVDETHKRGMAVILDVVYNHVFSQSPLAQLYWDENDFAPSAESPFLNTTARHPFNVGYDVNHESAFSKAWVKQTLSYWIEEFKIDGFRFDLSKGLTQTNSGDNAALMAQYDASRINILRDYADHIWSLDNSAYVILEHFADNSEEATLSNLGFMLWGNGNHDFSESAMGYSANLNWSSYTSRGWNNPHLVAYMESHDEERMMYRLENFGNSGFNYNTKEQKTALKRVAAAATIFYTIPGPKMLWQFGEQGYDFSINTCTDLSVNDNCRLDPKPIRWDYLNEVDRQELVEVISKLIRLKTNLPAFESNNFLYRDVTEYIKTVHLNHDEVSVIAMANFNIEAESITPNFQNTGMWYEFFSGDSILINDTQLMLSFEPGEYRLYTSQPVEIPEISTSVQDLLYDTIELIPSPNPVQAGQVSRIQHKSIAGDERIQVYNIEGRLVNIESTVDKGEIIIKWRPNMPSGMYNIILNGPKNVFYSAKVVLFK